MKKVSPKDLEKMWKSGKISFKHYMLFGRIAQKPSNKGGVFVRENP